MSARNLIFRLACGMVLALCAASEFALFAQSIQFTDISAPAGVNSPGKSGGVAFGDYNNDGYPDIYVCRQSKNILYQNQGNGTFLDATTEAGVDQAENSSMAVWSDFDNDGLLDLYVVRFGANYLFRNLGNGNFSDVSQAAGVDHAGRGVVTAVADVDNDGWLDIYIANFSQANVLYRNNRDWTFTDVTQESKAVDVGYAMGITFCDYDNDGDQDLLLSHDGDRGNKLYQNDGRGVFTDVASAANVRYAPLAMGVGFGDYDNDGLFDLYITVLGPNLLYKNEGTGRFTLLPSLPQYANDGGMGWGLTWFDCDNDGALDLYVANATNYSSPGFPNVLYHNQKDGSFLRALNGAGTANRFDSYGSAWADINNDGSLDLYVTNYDAPNQLFLNAGSSNHWLKVRLIGTVSNRDAIGARLRIVAGGRRSFSEVNAGGGYVSQNSFVQHFGLGQNTMVDTLDIRWPSGLLEKYTNIRADQLVTATEKQGIVTGISSRSQAENIPLDFSLGPNYPNPFLSEAKSPALGGGNPHTTFEFSIGGRTVQQAVIAVYDLMGKTVKTLIDKPLSPGKYSVHWDGRDHAGNGVGSGVYFVKMMTSKFVATRKVALVK